MMADNHQIKNLTDLRNFINETICENEQLEPGAFPTSERILLRSGTPCGIYFCVHGPRSVKFTAIWETDRNSVLFYNSGGQRYQKVRLTGTPSLVPVAA